MVAVISRIRLVAWSGVAIFSAAVWLAVAGVACAQYSPPLDYNSFPPIHAQNLFAETDCASGSFSTTGAGDWIQQLSTGTITAPNTNSTGSAGLCQFNTGNSATGRVSISLGIDATTAEKAGPIDFALGTAKFFAAFDEGTASVAADAYTARVGFFDSVTTTPVDGCYFRYAHGTNSGKWQIVSISNSVETAADSGLTFVATTRRTFGIVATSTSCAFYNANAQVTNSPLGTNIPSGGTRTVTAGVFILKSASTVDVKAMYVDYIAVEQRLSTPRNWLPF
jgi:hypothetical protein